jgi:hypothetical protein
MIILLCAYVVGFGVNFVGVRACVAVDDGSQLGRNM